MAREKVIQPYKEGVQNRFTPETIDESAAQDALNWVQRDGGVETTRGRELVGADTGDNTPVRGQHFGILRDGSTIQYRKRGNVIQYYDGSAWQDVVGGLTETAEYTFTNYISLAGAFTYVGSPDGASLIKIVNANPGSPVSLPQANNYNGYIKIDKSRMFLWGRDEDPTTLYYSHIDEQNYTTVSGEAVGASGSTNYTGTLAFKAGGVARTCFGIRFSDGSGQIVTDDGLGNLIGDGTGTINYATGAYDVTFNAVAGSSVVVDYQYEDSNNGGVTDFTFSSTRVAGEGGFFPQEIGGETRNLEVFDGRYYSIKRNAIYEVNIAADDSSATNYLFRSNIGITSVRGSVSTGIGIIIVDTANAIEPVLRLVYRSSVGDNLDVTDIAPKFDMSKYEWDETALTTWGQYVIMTGKTIDADRNDRVFRVDLRENEKQDKYAVSITDFTANTFAQDAGILYAGDSLSGNVFTMFSGFSDDGVEINNYWNARNERFDTERLKKTKRLRIQGKISEGVIIKIYASYDNDDYIWIGTVRWDGPYVDQSDSSVIGGTEIGNVTIGGEASESQLQNGIEVYNYFAEIRYPSTKFRQRSLRFEAEGIGFARIEMTNDYDIRLFGNKMPYKYRSKQNVSLDGNTTDMDNPWY